MIMSAFFLAYILNPAVNRLEKWRIPRSVSALGLLFAGLFLIVLSVLFIVPTIVDEVAGFVGHAPGYLASLKEHLEAFLKGFDIKLPQNWDQALGLVWDKTKAWLPEAHKLANPLAAILKKIASKTLGMISGLIHIVLIPVLAYYFLVSFNRIEEKVTDLIPPYARASVLEKLRQMDRALSGFVRGQLTICLILAVLYSIGFVMIGLDLAVVLGTVSGLLFIVPYLGTVIAILGGSLMALAQFKSFTYVIYVVVWITVVQLFESYVLTPRIVGEATGLHPLVYILALLVGAQLFGFVGMLVAVPVTACLLVLGSSAIELYRKSDIYQDREIKAEEQ
jgi:predicted PurR-regulated permease PerM